MKTSIIFLFISIPLLTFSQMKVQGEITDANGHPLSSVLITEVFSGMKFSGNMVQSDHSGKFKIELQKSESSLYITLLGYKPQSISLFPDINEFIKIKMVQDSAFILNEINVMAQKQTLILKNDRIVYDMSANPLKDNSTLQALRFVPLVMADENSFSIVGKDQTVVYINNRKSNMSPSNLLTYLKSLPADQIQNIEVITVPGSTFRGEGNFGIINIQLKGNELEGLKGYVLGRLWKTHYLKESGDLNISYAHGKSITHLSAGVANYSTWKKSEVESSYLQQELVTRKTATYKDQAPEFYANLQSDYQVSQQSTFGIVLNTFYSNSDGDETGLTSFSENFSADVDSLIDMEINHQVKKKSFAANANYRYHSNDSKQYFTLDFDYLNNQNKNYSQNLMNLVNSDLSIQSQYLNFEQEVPQIAQIVSGKIEYGKEMNVVGNFKMGFDMYYSNVDDDNRYRIWEKDSYVHDLIRSNHFEIKEFTSAFFAQTDKKWSSKVSTSIGLRLESTNYEGIQHTIHERFKTDYFRVLPSLNLNYRPADPHSFNYSISYRVNRPSFKNLNPFIQYTSPTQYSIGNPFLKPSGNFYQFFGYGLKNKYFLSSSFNISDRAINPIQIVKENNVIENTLVNMGTVKTFRTWFNTFHQYLKGKASSNFNIGYEWKQVQGSSKGGELDYTHSSFMLNLQNNLTISQKHDLSFDFGGSFNSKNRNSFLTYPSTLNLNGQIRKGIGDFQLSLYTHIVSYLYGNRISQVWNLKRKNTFLIEKEYSKGETTSIGFSISYNFGNSKVKRANQRKGSNSEVKSRVY